VPTLPDVGSAGARATGDHTTGDKKANGVSADGKDCDKKESEKGRSGESATTQGGEGGSPPSIDANMASSTISANN